MATWATQGRSKIVCPLCRSKIDPGADLKPAHRAIRAVVDSLKVYCPTCRSECARSVLLDHVSKCPVDCPRECGAKVTPRNRVKHNADCPLVPVPCSAADVGCEASVVRAQLELHESHCEFARNHSMLKRIAALEAKVAQIARLEHENLEMKQQLAELKPIQKDMIELTIRLRTNIARLRDRLKEKEDTLAGLEKRLFEEARLAWPRFQLEREEQSAKFNAQYYTTGKGASIPEAQKLRMIAADTVNNRRDVPDAGKAYALLRFADHGKPYSWKKEPLTDDEVFCQRIDTTLYQPLQTLLEEMHELKSGIAQLMFDEPPGKETIDSRYPRHY